VSVYTPLLIDAKEIDSSYIVMDIGTFPWPNLRVIMEGIDGIDADG